MPVSSYAVRCRDSERPEIIARLDALPGVTVGEETPQGIPVVAESETSRAARELGEQLEQVLADVEIVAPTIPVVHNVHAQTESDPENIRALLVYHNFEDDP